jgi:8-oxo-dGTP pyrophosphatase MutT (NUDIX family)
VNRTSGVGITEETDLVPMAGGPSHGDSSVPVCRVVVAVVIEWQHRIALFRRSADLEHDGGRWHCITGFLEPGVTPYQQALQELAEETGLVSRDLVELKAGPCLALDDSTGAPWLVHTFTALSARRRLQINWEHDAYRWTAPAKVRRFSNQVSWLEAVLLATGHSAA